MIFPYFANFTVDIDPLAVQRGGSFCSEGAYAPQGIQRCYEYLRDIKEPVLVDIGANSGSYALLATLIPTLKVFAFEPVKESRKLLTKHVRDNGVHERVMIFREAVGDKNERATLYTVSPDSSSALSIVNGKPAYHKTVEASSVPMVTLDSICERFEIAPTLLKIDTEGSELLVLSGAQEIIARYLPAIQVEGNRENCEQYGYTPERTEEFLVNLGYVVTTCADGDYWAVVP